MKYGLLTVAVAVAALALASLTPGVALTQSSPTWEDFEDLVARVTGLEDRMDDVESRLSALEGETDGDGSTTDSTTDDSGSTTDSTTDDSGSTTDSTTDDSGSTTDSTTDDSETTSDSSGACDRTFSGEVAEPGGFTVPAGETWCFDPGVTTRVETGENVVVKGTLRMNPSSADVVHTLKFEGVDETQMVGGDTSEPIPEDVGLWVVDNGQLDLRGTPRAGWNRAGDDSTWRTGDDIRVAPIERGDTTTFAAFTPGDPVPSVTAPDGSEHKAEVFNLTRNVRIHGGGSNPPDEVLSDDGRAHIICLRCQQPQTIKHAELRWLGPRAEKDNGNVDGLLGRYALHFHHGADGTRGSEVTGTIVRDAGNHAYVPHSSHGITFTDTISFDTIESAYWWDKGDQTRDVLFDHAAVFGVTDHPQPYGLHGFTLGAGVNMTVRDSVVVGHQGQKSNAGGFHWPSSIGGENTSWTFEDNVAHNNRGAGLSVWQNNSEDHLVTGYVGYRNGKGILHGAYQNQYHYADSLLFGNDVGVQQNALSTDQNAEQLRFDRLNVGTVELAKHSVGSDVPVIWRNTEVRDRVVVDEAAEAGMVEFRYDCDHTDIMLDVGDFDLVRPLSDISVVNECSGATTVINR